MDFGRVVELRALKARVLPRKAPTLIWSSSSVVVRLSLFGDSSSPLYKVAHNDVQNTQVDE